MSRKGENIHKRKDGRWEARVRIISNSEKKKYKSIYGKSYSEVKSKVANFYKESGDDGFRTIQNCSADKKLAEIMEEWFLVKQMSQKASTQLKYHTIAENHILPILGHREISEITETEISEFLVQKLNKGKLHENTALSPSYVKTMGIMLNSVIAYAVVMDYRKPMKSKIVKPLERKHEITIMDCLTQKKLEDSLKINDSVTATGIMLALNSGMRIGEICALRWDDIDFHTNVIHVRHTISRIKNTDESTTKTILVIDEPKTKTSNRKIPINSKLLPILHKAKANAVSEFVISDKKEFMSPRTFEYRFHQALKKLAIPDINFHALRHTFATRCIELGVDIKTLSEILGHSNVSITLNTYVHSSIQHKREQMEKLTLLGF
ncbi:MAG: site-specific integrase [Lachnospiraceae bacterium]|nr:site-specific integrase [Lachnospiraceae bacterium]